MNKLEDSYSISVDDMIPMPEAYRSDTWGIDGAEFLSPTTHESVILDVLYNVNDPLQIFAMKDDSYILEVDNFHHLGKVDYYKDRDINKLKEFKV